MSEKQNYENYHREYRQRPYAKEKRKEYQKVYKKEYRQKPEVKARRRARRQTPEVRKQDYANGIVLNEIKQGRIKKEPCERCGSDESIHAHHPDYDKPLKIIWLCPECHGKEHSKIS